jgi:glycosyltransferase involved in cell wall biosynthesis
MNQGAISPFVRRVESVLAGRTVLQIIPKLQAGGAERTTIDIAVALNEVGARALVASVGGRLVSELQAKGGLWVPFPANTKNPFAMAMNVGKLMRLIQTEKVDIVHARSRAPAWVAYVATRRTGVPFVTTFHGSYSGRSALKLQYNSVMARSDCVIANSRYTAGLIEEHYPFAHDKLHVIYRGTDFREFSAAQVEPLRVRRLREAWGLAADERIVLLAARLTGWKGHRVLIEAARQLMSENFQDVRFILAGDDQGRSSYLKELDGLIAAANLEGVVRRVDHCTDMPAAFLAASVVVVPSTEPEAFGRSAVEAQAMGTPVVVSDLGAVPETVLAPPDVRAEERTGWRVPPGDATALAEAIAHALRLGAAARDAMAIRARAHVESQFSVERMKRETLDAYAAIIAGKANAGADEG